jgi:hypothetical protein
VHDNFNVGDDRFLMAVSTVSAQVLSKGAQSSIREKVVDKAVTDLPQAPLIRLNWGVSSKFELIILRGYCC